MPPFNHTTLSTERLVLRPLRESDAAGLFAVFSDPRVARYLSRPAWADTDVAHARIARDIEAMSVGRYACFGIERTADDRLLGECSLFKLIAQCRRAELGYMRKALSALLASEWKAGGRTGQGSAG